jgi:glycosyltransferase involved in cell wall biosynthesis
MKIAINAWFLDRPGTGSGQYLNGLLRALPAVASEHHFLLVTPPGVPACQIPGLRVEFWPYETEQWNSNLGKVLFEQVAFPRACRQWGADVVHVPYWGSPLWSAVPTVVTIHDLIPLLLPDYRGGPLVRLYTRLVSASARRAAVVLTDSLSSKGDIEDHLGLPAGCVRCIYLAADEQYSPDPEPDDELIREIYDLPRRYILYLAGHDVRKNVARLVEAFATVARSDDDVTLVIGGKLPAGDEPPFYDPRPLVEVLSLSDHVRFPGWVEAVHAPALYRGAACAVFPSRYEGFGLPVLEALACGTPLITSNTSSLPELAGDAGFVLDPDDVEGLAGAMLACLVDEPLVAELRQRGPQQAGKFTWAQTAGETLAAYQDAVAGGAD